MLFFLYLCSVTLDPSYALYLFQSIYCLLTTYWLQGCPEHVCSFGYINHYCPNRILTFIP